MQNDDKQYDSLSPLACQLSRGRCQSRAVLELLPP